MSKYFLCFFFSFRPKINYFFLLSGKMNLYNKGTIMKIKILLAASILLAACGDDDEIGEFEIK